MSLEFGEVTNQLPSNTMSPTRPSAAVILYAVSEERDETLRASVCRVWEMYRKGFCCTAILLAKWELRSRETYARLFNYGDAE